MWFLNVAWKTDSEKFRTESYQQLKLARKYPLSTSSQLVISRNSKSKEGVDIAPNFIIPVKTISSKNGIINVGSFDPDSDPNDESTRPILELECNKEKGIDLCQAQFQPDGQKWKVMNHQDLIQDLEEGNQEDFLMDISKMGTPDLKLGLGDKHRLKDGDVICLSASVFAVVEWVPLAICSKDKTEKNSISKDLLSKFGIYFTYNSKVCPKGYNYYSTEKINLGFGPLQASVNQCTMVKPGFSRDLLKNLERVLKKNSQLLKDEKGVGIDMEYKSFKVPEIDGNSERGHTDLEELENNISSIVKKAIIDKEKDRSGIFKGVTFFFFVVDPIDQKTLQVGQRFAGLAGELDALVKIQMDGRLSGVSEGKTLLQSIQKEAFDNFQKARKKSKLLIGSEPDCLILVPLYTVHDEIRTAEGHDTLNYLLCAASELEIHDLGLAEPLHAMFRAIATMDVRSLCIGSNTQLGPGERGEETRPNPITAPSTSDTSIPPTRRTGRSEPDPTSNDAPTQDEPMDEIPPTNHQPPPKAAPTPLRRRTRTNKVDNGLDPTSSGQAEENSADKEAPVTAPTPRTGPLKRRARNADDVTAFFMGSSTENASKDGPSSMSNLKGSSQPQSYAKRLLAEEDERERREAMGESYESEMADSNQDSGSRKRLKTNHEVSKKSNLETVGEDAEMDVDQDVEVPSKQQPDANGKNKRRAEDDYEDEEMDQDQNRQVEPTPAAKQKPTARKRRENEDNNPTHPSKTGLTIQATQDKGNEDGDDLAQDVGFLEALKSRAKTNRSIQDDFDKDFNKMRISKSKLTELNKVEVDEEYEAWKKLTNDELEGFKTQSGNFIKVDKISLVRNQREQGRRMDGSHYQDGVLKGEWKEEWNGRINHKKFKKVDRIQRVPLTLSLSEVHDYGLGPGYGSKPKPTASKDEMDQDDLEEENSQASDQEHLSIAPASRAGRKNTGRNTQANSTQGKRKGNLVLDWSEEEQSDDDQDDSLGSTAANKNKGKGKAGKAQIAAQKKKAAAEAKKAKAKGGKGKKKKGVIDSDEEEDELQTASDEDEEPELNLDLDISDDNDGDEFSFAKPAKKSTRKAPAARTATTSKSKVTSRQTKSPTPTNKTSSSSTLKASMDLDESQPVTRPGSGRLKTGNKRNVETIQIDDSDEDADGDGDFAGFGKGSKRRR